MHKVCMFNVYFGNLPHWLDFFVQSANYNQEYDFYIFNEERYIKSMNCSLRPAHTFLSYLACNKHLIAQTANQNTHQN